MDLSKLVDTIQQSLGEGLPTVFAALLIFLIGYFVAKILKGVTRRILRKTDLDNRIAKSTGTSMEPEKSISNLVYYVVMVIVLLVTMETLGITQILDPLKNMVDQFIGFIPNLVAAGLIGFIGYVLAKIVSSLVQMASGTLENWSTKAGFKSDINLTSILTNVVFVIIFIPILIAALDALQMDAITQPAKEMLSTFIATIPKIIAAAATVTVFYFLGRFISSALSKILFSLGTDSLSEKLLPTNALGTGGQLSSLIGKLAFAFILFLGIITGAEQLEFNRLNEVLGIIFEFSGRILFGLVLMVLGNYLANLAYTAMSSSNNEFLASLTRIVILGLVLAMSLRAMGIADNIVNLAFGLTLGSVAVAVALSFGLGGREAAGEQMKRILDRFNKK